MFLSVGLAGAVVFVFTGRPIVTFLATLTVLSTCVTVMGILKLRGWTIGAIEGMSITSLVGLAVDFTIHLADGYIHARAESRVAKARCAAAHSVLAAALAAAQAILGLRANLGW